MFDIGFWELSLVAIIGLVVLGPERLPVAIRTVRGWMSSIRSFSEGVKSELSEELRIQEQNEIGFDKGPKQTCTDHLGMFRYPVREGLFTLHFSAKDPRCGHHIVEADKGQEDHIHSDESEHGIGISVFCQLCPFFAPNFDQRAQ